MFQTLSFESLGVGDLPLLWNFSTLLLGLSGVGRGGDSTLLLSTGGAGESAVTVLPELEGRTCLSTLIPFSNDLVASATTATQNSHSKKILPLILNVCDRCVSIWELLLWPVCLSVTSLYCAKTARCLDHMAPSF